MADGKGTLEQACPPAAVPRASISRDMGARLNDTACCYRVCMYVLNQLLDVDD